MKKLLFTLILIFLLSTSLWAMAKMSPAKQAALKATTSQALTLDDCFRYAFKRSEALAIKKEEIGRSFANFLEATGEVVGDFDFVVTDFHQDSDGSSGASGSIGSTFSAPERRERKFVMSQPLFQGFKAIGALTGSGSLAKQHREEWQRAKQLLFLDVVNFFYDRLRIEKDTEIISGIFTASSDRIKELHGWEEIGRSRTSEVRTAESQHGVFGAQQAHLKGELAVSKNLMEFLTGVSVESKILKDAEIPQVTEEKINFLELANERPDVKASLAAVQTARSAFIVAQSELWPKLSLDANLYEKREGFQSGTSWDTLFTFTVPLGKGGETIGKVKEAYSTWKQAKLFYSLTQRTAEKEIKDALDWWASSLERYHALDEAVKAAEQNFTLQKEEYEHRLVNNLDVLQALELLFETKRDANAAYFDMKKNYWRLEVAKGNCCEKEVLSLREAPQN